MGGYVERDPCKHIMADLSSEKHNLHLNQYSTQLYGSLFFSEIIVTETIVAVGPIPPDDEKN